MSANDIVLQKLEHGLLTITMNRPDRRNALNPDMTRGLVEAARRAAEDHEVRAVRLKGAGGTFCVGGDVKSMAEGRAPLAFEAKTTNLYGFNISAVYTYLDAKVTSTTTVGAPSRAGAISTANVIDLQLANTWSLGTDLDRALAAARQCERDASRIRAHRIEAIAINVQAVIAANRASRVMKSI